MIRTQIRLESAVDQRMQQYARQQQISPAEFVRRAASEALPVESDKPDFDKAFRQGISTRHFDQAWMRFAGVVESGDSESSRSIDDVAYGRKD